MFAMGSLTEELVDTLGLLIIAIILVVVFFPWELVLVALLFF